MHGGTSAEEAREEVLKRDAEDGQAGADYTHVHLDGGPEGGVGGCPGDVGLFAAGAEGGDADYGGGCCATEIAG